ncbi:uncharacterized protein LOC130996778 isoform X2 [Salvia miltiorrhiza]|uniref:uncharacterized protein LOC130996778 isoform X2 n=1 Tax=Salvia miltiorrhiza TaxID=226208 RepID=UPI0025ACB682|nr:uncharacterized protein LOC130996778 isoform X2 [Salvia miltiorrhiza]
MCYINYHTSEITDMKERKIWDSYTVKAQAFKTAIEAACMLLRIDDIGKRKGVEPTECLYDAYEILHKNKDGTYTDESFRALLSILNDLWTWSSNCRMH